MTNAVEEAVKIAESRDLTVALDGTWHKRGFQSLNGVVTATSVEHGKVVDVAIFSKHCLCKEKQKNIHSPSCIANNNGASGGMEVEKARQIFSQSVPKFNVRYVYYLGAGDSKGFMAVIKDMPYGPDIKIMKREF